MGGWLLFSTQDSETYIQRFRRNFTVSGVPPLQLSVRKLGNDLGAVCWAWDSRHVPDILLVESDAKALLLHGYVTGLGRFGPPNPDQRIMGLQLLEIWQRWGHEAIAEVNGSFSLAFMDIQEGCVTIYADRCGSRSIWFALHGKQWYTGNFPAAIAALQQKQLHLDPVGLWSLFSVGRHIGKHGIYQGINSLQAGGFITLRPGQMATSRWWQREYHPRNGVSAREWGSEIARTLRLSAQRIKAITPDAHLFLSGGLDSRVAAAAIGGELTTHTLCSQYNIEARIANIVARQLDLEHHTIIRTPYWYLDTFEAAALLSGGNFNILNTHFMVPVCAIKQSRAEACFFLGDLLEHFNKDHFHSNGIRINNITPDEISALFHNLYAYTHPDPHDLAAIFQPNIRQHLRQAWRDALSHVLDEILLVSENPRDWLDTLARWYSCNTCPTYNMIECIWPFAGERNLMFDNDIVDLYLTIPADIRSRGVLHTWTLWHLNKSLAFIPNANYWLPPVCPRWMNKGTWYLRPWIGRAVRTVSSALNQPSASRTQGSWMLFADLYRTDKKYRHFIEQLLHDRDALPSDIFILDNVVTHWQEFLAGHSKHRYEIEMLVSFALLQKLLPTSGLG